MDYALLGVVHMGVLLQGYAWLGHGWSIINNIVTVVTAESVSVWTQNASTRGHSPLLNYLTVGPNAKSFSVLGAN